jgi:formylglycine-generating enzyme required for sulfatase activity
MKRIPAGIFSMGSHDAQGRTDEYPVHQVRVKAFWMDETEVSNAAFAAFVKSTGYITTAEKAIDWEELSKQVPKGTPKPADSLLAPSSLVFVPTTGPVDLTDYSQWWAFKRGADWHIPLVKQQFKDEKIIPSFMFHGMMQPPMPVGPAKDYPQKQNGNGPAVGD